MRAILFILIVLAVIGIGYQQANQSWRLGLENDPENEGIVNVPETVMPKVEEKTETAAHPVDGAMPHPLATPSFEPAPAEPLAAEPVWTPPVENSGSELEMPGMPDTDTPVPSNAIPPMAPMPEQPAEPLLFEQLTPETHPNP